MSEFCNDCEIRRQSARVKLCPKHAATDGALNLLKEWANTPYWGTQDDWEAWGNDFGSRVDALLAKACPES